jgi:hypothetical protein
MLLRVLDPRLQMPGYRVDCVQLPRRYLSARLMAHTITNLPSRHRRGLEVWLYSSFNLGPRCGNCSTPRPSRCTPPGKSPGTHCTRGWMGPPPGSVWKGFRLTWPICTSAVQRRVVAVVLPEGQQSISSWSQHQTSASRLQKFALLSNLSYSRSMIKE